MSVDPVEMSAIVLRTVAGKEHVLYAPFTLDRLLRAATEQLHFHRESVKAVSQGRTVKLVDLCTNPEDLTRPLTPTELEMLVSRPATRPDYGSTAESSKKQSSTNSPSSTSGAAAMPCIILSGVPCSISRRAAKHDNTSVRSSANGPMASMPPSEGPVSTGGHQAPGASGNASVPVASSSSPGSSGPLQYPHSTTGISELAVLAESYDELCLHSFPWAMYEHPTMQHIIAMVNGDLTQLQHILAQVFDISSPLFDWFMRHSVLLVRMLNRSVPDDTLSINPLAHIAQQITGSLQAGQQTDFVLNVGGHELNLVLHVGNFDDGAVVEDEEASSMEWDSQEEAVQLNMLVEGLLGDELQNFQIEVVTGSEDDTESDGSSSSTPADSSDACEEEPSTSVASPLTAGTVITATQAVNLEDLAHAELSALIQQSQVEIQRALHRHATNRVLLTSAHTNLQSVSVVLMNELETNLDHVDHEKGFHWLVNAACTFYTTAESFYLTLIRELSTVEQQSIFGSDAVDSCAALACRAALGRQLYWEAVQLLEHSARLASQRVESLVSRAPRVGALRNLPTDCTPLIDACVSWIKGSGPKNLLQDLLNSSRAQRSTILWYCCTAAPEAPSASSSTTASVCYAICGVNGANAIHATQGLPRRGDRSSSTTPKGSIFPPTESELLACLERVRGSGASSPEDELAWTAMMQRSYASLVKPVEAILPPAGSSDLVYVVESTPLSSCSQPHVGSTRSLSPARWFPAYMDGAQLCLEKWCLVVSDSLWNVQLAAEAPVVNPKAQLRSIVLSEASQPTWLSPDITDALRFECCTLEGSTPKQSAAVIHVVRPSSTTPTTTTTAAISSSASATHPVGDASSSPVVVLDWQPAAVAGDLLVVEAGNKSAAAVLQLAHRPQKARVVQQTAAMSAEDASLFFADFYAVLAGVVRVDADELTLAAAFQHAMVRVLNAHDHHAPWLATSFVLLDYGHQLDSLASAVGAQGRTLGESSPQTSAAPILPSIDQPEVALAYAKTHAVNDLYEVVLERLLSERPEEEIAIYENLIDSLNHVRRSKKRGGGEADPTSTARPAVEPAPQARQSSSEAPVASNASEGDLSIASPASPPAGPQPPRPPAQGKPGAGGRSNRRYFC